MYLGISMHTLKYRIFFAYSQVLVILFNILYEGLSPKSWNENQYIKKEGFFPVLLLKQAVSERHLAL
jgi:hypothetical protein